MESDMMANISKTRKKALEFIYGMMAASTRVGGTKVSNMVLALTSIPRRRA